MSSLSNKQKNTNIVILFLMIFLVNSFCGWLLFTIYIFFNQEKKKTLLLWSISTIIFVSLYNATKIPENDLDWYVDFYLAAGRMSFKQYLTMLTGGKEQLYQVLAYGIHFLGGDNYHIYIFTVSIITYSCLLRVLVILKDALRLSGNAFIATVSFLCFFPYTYAISVHLVRQVLASSIILWLLFEYYRGFNKKACIIGAFSTILIHSSAIFILPFFLIKQIGQPINRKNLWIYLLVICMIFSISIIGREFLNYFTTDSAAGYIANKMANGTTFETTLSLAQLILSICFVVGGYISLYIHKPITRIQSFLALMFLHITSILLIFILANTTNPELQLRCNFFFWTYASLFIAIYFASFKINKFISFSVFISLFIFLNIYNISLSQWTYTCCEDYLMYSMFHYFF